MQEINNKIQDIVVTLYKINIDNIDNWLTHPPKPEFWDYAFNIFEIAKVLKRNPAEISAGLKLEFSKFPEYFENVSNMWGYVNFFINPKILLNEFSQINLNNKKPKNQTIIVDYIWANVWKPLHIGHLCTPSLWQSIINIHEYLGYDVISDSHFWDWGGIFGKLITMFKLVIYSQWDKDKKLSEDDTNIYSRINSIIEEMDSKIKKDEPEIAKKIIFLAEYLQNNSLNNKDDLKYLFNTYQLITIFAEKSIIIDNQCREEFKKLSEWDPQNISLWKQITNISINEVSKQLEEELWVKPKYNIWESFYEWIDLPKIWNHPDLIKEKEWMKAIVEELKKNLDIVEENEDWSVGVVFPEETKLSSCVLQKKDWTWLYLTSDLAAIKYRLDNWKPAKIIYFVDVRQQLHLKQAFYIAREVWSELKKTELIHAYNWFIKLKEGAMSTRKWTVIFLKDLIDEGYKRTEEILKWKGRELSPENIKAVTIAAIKYSYLSQDREKDIVFDWDKALSFEWNSGPYIQYAYVRARKILKTPSPSGTRWMTEPESVPWGRGLGWGQIELSQYDKSLIKKLLEFEGKVGETASKYKPHILAQYCYELASEFNSFYVHTPKILEESNEDLKNLRLNMIEKFAQTLKKWFELLAINMPDEM